MAIVSLGCAAALLSSLGQPVSASAGGGTNGRIAFLALDHRGRSQVFSMAPDGGDVRQVTHVTRRSGAHDPAWSPDARVIAYSADSSYGDAEIRLIDADGSHDRVLMHDPLFLDFQPSFSPDGRTVLFTRCIPGSNCTLYTIRSDGTRLHQLLPFSKDGADTDGHYSPDGSLILDSHFYQGAKIAALAIMNADGSGLHTITPGRLTAADGEWSPDGGTIAFFSHCCDPKISAIWTVRSDGSDRTRLTRPAPEHDFVPTYAPDGASIAFERDREDFSSWGIWVMGADGSGAVEINDGGFNPSWSPAGATP